MVDKQTHNASRYVYSQQRRNAPLTLVRRADAARLSGDDQAAIELVEAAYKAFDKLTGNCRPPLPRPESALP